MKFCDPAIFYYKPICYSLVDPFRIIFKPDFNMNGNNYLISCRKKIDRFTCSFCPGASSSD